MSTLMFRDDNGELRDGVLLSMLTLLLIAKGVEQVDFTAGSGELVVKTVDD